MIGLLPNSTFHFNLSTRKGRLDDPTNLKVHANKITTMEFETVKSLFPNKTYYYEKSGSYYKQVFLK